MVQVVHFQNAAGECALRLPYRAVRLPDALHLQHPAHRPHMNGFPRDLLTDLHFPRCLLCQLFIAAQQTLIFVRAVYIRTLDRDPFPALPLFGIKLLQHGADAAAGFLCIINDRRPARFVGGRYLVLYSIPCVQDSPFRPFLPQCSIPPCSPFFFSVSHLSLRLYVKYTQFFTIFLCKLTAKQIFWGQGIRLRYTVLTEAGNARRTPKNGGISYEDQPFAETCTARSGAS